MDASQTAPALKYSFRRDQRLFQIAFLGSLLSFGVFQRDFLVDAAFVLVTLATVWLTQTAAILRLGLAWNSLLSATISGLGLCLLCRANSLGWVALAAAISIASKFLIRWKGKHFFNPTNLGIVVLLVSTSSVWVSPAQWGTERLLVFWVLAMGLWVTFVSRRSDVSLVFLGTYVTLLVLRVLWLGQPTAVLFHQLQSGALLVFTFFMISDPRATPDAPTARIGFGVAVAVLAYVLRFHFYSPNALLYALFLLSPLTPILDSLWSTRRFEWGMPLATAPA